MSHKTFIKIQDVCNKTSLSKSTVYRLIQKSKFPRQVKITDYTSVWVLSEVDEWIETTIADRDGMGGL